MPITGVESTATVIGIYFVSQPDNYIVMNFVSMI